jgi:hypothetical protein
MFLKKLLTGLHGQKRDKYVLYVRNENSKYGGRSKEMSINPLETNVSFQNFDTN